MGHGCWPKESFYARQSVQETLFEENCDSWNLPTGAGGTGPYCTYGNSYGLDGGVFVSAVWMFQTQFFCVNVTQPHYRKTLGEHHLTSIDGELVIGRPIVVTG